jgi:hypothetical protein
MSNLSFDELDEKTIKLMNDAGITPVKGAYSFNAAINRLIKVVRQNEREACAALCESGGDDYEMSGAYWCADAIRARGKK